MVATMFFKTLRHGREMHFRTLNKFLSDLCDVGMVSVGPKNYDNVKEHFRERVYGKPKRKAMDPMDPKTAAIMESFFAAGIPVAMRAN